MAQTEYQMRVRPSKVAILIPSGTDFGPVSAAIRYLSWLWGGRFGWIIPVTPGARDERALRWLDLQRPDVVYMNGVVQEIWRPLVAAACQPMNCGPFTPHSEATPFTPIPDNLITCRPILELLYHEAALRRRASFYHALPTAGHPLAPFVKAVFGHFDASWAGVAGPPNREPPRWLQPEEGVPGFIDVCTQASAPAFRGWLDVGSDELGVELTLGGEAPPTVVVVAGGDDLALYWNLRSPEEVDEVSWILPVPISSAADAAVHRQVELWLEAVIGRSGKRPNSCQVVSLTAERSLLDALANALRPCVTRLNLTYVDVHVPYEALPRVTPISVECTQSVDVDNRDVTLVVPKPDVAQALDKRGKWIVDLKRDVRTDRAPCDLVMPRRPCLIDILNVPAPPTLPSRSAPHLGLAETGVALRASNRDEVAHLRLPSDEEVLLEILREGGIQPKGDEKREAYSPAIEAFGGVRKAARASRGRLRAILRELEQKEQLTLSEIKEKAKLGNAKLPELLQRQVPKELLEGISDVARRVSRQRFESQWREANPDDHRLQSLLDHWESRAIVRRCWQLGPCPKAGCGHVSWEDGFDPRRPIRCEKCGELGYMQPDAVGAYSLAIPIRFAISEGMLPVILAGEVLRKLSDDGFFWLPGVKYDRQDISADIDVFACCDGYLVMLECKDLEGMGMGEGTWNQLFEQFTELVAAARQVRADIVGVATLAGAFPAEWIAKARDVTKGLGLLLLDKAALEEEMWPVNAADKKQVRSIRDLVTKTQSRPLMYDPPGERFIEHQGLWRFTYGG